QSLSPPSVSFSSCGTSATPAYWALSSGAYAGYFSVYAPNHVVYELGGGDFYGAIVAWIYYSTGGGRFHYDEALARQPSNRLEVQRGSWAQLPGSRFAFIEGRTLQRLLFKGRTWIRPLL